MSKQARWLAVCPASILTSAASAGRGPCQCASRSAAKSNYSSPLERAVETAEPIADGRKIEIQLRPELMDNDIGHGRVAL